MSRIVLQGQRDEKRREIESNFEARTALRLEFNERLQALQDESHRLEEELQALDDEIEALQESQEEEQEETAQTPQGSPTDSSTRMVVPASTQNDFGTVVRDSRQDRSPSTARSFPWTRAIHHLLRTTFGLHAFRPHQEQVVDATLSGQDVFFLLRTGGGKSLCYQLPALYETAKLTLVVSPLVALLHDQERHLNNLQPNCAVSLQGTVKQQDWQRAFNTRTTRVVFVTPERIAKSKTLWHHLSTLYQRQTLGRFVIDEAHCVSQWGHDFRPDYAQLGRLKQHFPSVPLLCLTATASLRVQQDVTQLLHLSQPLFVTPSSADRPNLRYQVRAKHSATVVADMARYIQDHHAHSAGIIYTLTQNDAQQVAHQLQHHFALPARPYHAGLSDAVKTRTQQDWMTDQVPIIVATIAFGLGIHKPNVRFVLHHTISKTLEAYAQESGRAGRDELPADCVLWYSPKDVMKVLAMISGTSVHTFWPMVRYGQTHGNDALCRAILLTKLGDKGIAVPAVFDQQVYHTTDARTVTNHVRTVLQLIQSQPWTMAKLVQEWRSKNPTLPCLIQNPPHKDLTVDECERILVMLLVEEIIHPKIVTTKYRNVVYMEASDVVDRMIASKDLHVVTHLPKKSTTTTITTTTITVKEIRKTAKQSTAKQSTAKQSRKKRKQSTAAQPSPCGQWFQKQPPVIDLMDDDDSKDARPPLAQRCTNQNDEVPVAKPQKLKRNTRDLWEDESDEEFEFEG